jgi:hypothetical protein
VQCVQLVLVLRALAADSPRAFQPDAKLCLP